MINARPETICGISSPRRNLCRSRLRNMQGKPARFYQTTWDLSPACDISSTWNGLLLWDSPSEDEEFWYGFTLNAIFFRISVIGVSEAESREFDIIDASGNVVTTESHDLERNTWLMRFQEWIPAGPTRTLATDHWYSKVGGWTPKGTYELLLNASPNDPIFGAPHLRGPYTLTPTRL